MPTQNGHVFDRSGLSALSDLKTDQWADLFRSLEEQQKAFLEKEPLFRSPDYRWPRDILHYWSRVWEYPYVYHHLEKQREAGGSESAPRVVDLGSAVTFFPFAVARLGYHVTCLDIDASCQADIERAARVVSHRPGQVDFRMICNDRLPLQDGEADAVYCVSVLEHVQQFEQTIGEVARILKPGGLFLLTIDLDLCGYLDIGADRYNDLRCALAQHFDLGRPEITVHPCDVLQPRNGPFPSLTFSAWQKAVFAVKQRVLKPLLGRAAFRGLPNLAVWGGVMRRQSAGCVSQPPIRGEVRHDAA